MSDLVDFFEKEKNYVEDLRTIVEKKLVTSSSAANIKDYIASFEDILGDQVQLSETFLEDLSIKQLFEIIHQLKVE